MPVNIKLKWVKGHQDTNIFGGTINGPFLLDVMMNIRVDELASKGMKMGNGEVKRKEILSTEVISLYNKKNIQISNLRRYMVININGKEIKDYMMKRKGWTSEDMRLIEWEGVELMLNSANSTKKSQLIKLIHNWQNTGQQKGKFRDARLKLDSDNPLNPTEDEIHCHMCPDGCNTEETDMHYLNCPAEHTIKRRRVHIRRVLQRLKNLRTYEGITSTIGLILEKISKQEEMVFDWEAMQSDGDMSLISALEGQQKIGWTCFCQGFYHKEWTTIQMRYYRRLGTNSRSLNIRRWKKLFSTILTDYSLECWKNRNESIHGNEIDESRKKKKAALGRQIKGLYNKQDELRGETKRRVFSMPLKQRLGMGIHSSKLWISLAEEMLRRHREKAKKATIYHWLQP